MSKPVEFYPLERAPFEDGVRDAAAVGTRPLRAALARTRQLLAAETAVVCVGGRPGVGKTYFGLALPTVLASGTRVARISQPAQPWSALHGWIAKGFDVDPQRFSVDALHKLREAGQRLLIEVDPVDELPEEAFASLLSLLSHAYTPKERLVQAVLIGALERLGSAARDGLKALGAASLELEPLPEGDVPSYIQKRLDRAGYRGQPLFTHEAAEEVRARSEGTPREINRICMRALELGAERRAQAIDAEIVREACAEEPAPRAVIGRMKLKPRATPPPSAVPAGPPPAAQLVRRIEPLPPEPVVQAEIEAPLVDAEILEDADSEAIAASAPAVEAEPRAPAPVSRVVVAPPKATSDAAGIDWGDVNEELDLEPASARRARTAAKPTAPEPPPAVEPPAPPRTAPGPAPEPEVRTAPKAAVAAIPAAAPTVPPVAPTPTPAAVRRFPWLRVLGSLIAAWVLAAGVLWVHERIRAPEPAVAFAATASPAPAPPAPAASAPPPSSELLDRAQPEVDPPASPPAAPPAPAPTPPSPVQVAKPAAPAVAPAAKAPPKPALRVELRSRGREILYPPRPESAYAMPTPSSEPTPP